jgi:SSS family solute:Na+ symporter
LGKGDQIYPKLVFEMLPSGLKGLVLIGFIAAMTSVLTSTLNSVQTLVTMDILNKLRPGMSNRRQVVAGSISGLVIITIAALWSPQIQKFNSIVKYFQQLLSYMCPPVVAVFLCGLFWRRATASGAFAGLISGLVIACSLLFGIKHTPLAGWNFLYVAPVLVSLVTAPPTAHKVKTYVWNPQVFRDESRELAGVPWFKNYRVLAILLLVVTGVFIFIWR